MTNDALQLNNTIIIRGSQVHYSSDFMAFVQQPLLPFVICTMDPHLVLCK